MVYDPRTGITTYGEVDVAADPGMDLAGEAAPSTATSFAPAYSGPALPLNSLKAGDPIGYGHLQSLVQDFGGSLFTTVPGVEGLDPQTNPTLAGLYQQWKDTPAGEEFRGVYSPSGNQEDPSYKDPSALAQLFRNHENAKMLQGLMDQFGVDRLVDLPPEIVEMLPGRGLYESRSPHSVGGQFLDFVTNPGALMFLSAGLGGMLGAGGGAAAGGTGLMNMKVGLAAAQALKAARAGAGVGDVIGMLAQGSLPQIGSAIQPGLENVFGAFGPDSGASPSMSAPTDSFPTLADSSGAYLKSAFGPTASAVPGMPVAPALPGLQGMFGSSYDITTGVPFDPTTGMPTGSAVPPQFDGTLESLLNASSGQTQAEAPQAPEQPPALDTAARLLKLGAQLAQMSGGQSAPEDAPQRSEGQSDADYAQSLATYIQVDAQALADMGLTPGTPEYHEYLMSQLDATVDAMTQEIDVDAQDLEEQLRGKTSAELTTLRRALFVRGQLEQLMGSGAYTDPFTGLSEEVITGGRQVQPGVAAYHRGLGRTISEFAGLSPMERQRAIGGFLGRDADPYGMQAKADAQAEKAAQAQMIFEDLKRRRGLFNQSQAFPQFSAGMTGDPELDAIFGLGSGQDDSALRRLFGQ